jgi:hypothetical protein
LERLRRTMPHRIAMSMAVLLATVVGFAAVTLGAERGLLRERPGDAPDPGQPGLAQATVLATPTPNVIEMTVHREEYVEVPVPAAAPADLPPAAEVETAGHAAIADGREPDHSAEGGDNEGHEGQDDEPEDDDGHDDDD